MDRRCKQCNAKLDFGKWEYLYKRRTFCSHKCYGESLKGTRRVDNPTVANPLYHIWTSMKGRCLNPNNHAFARYGGRGITVCAKWRDSFQAFEQWAIDQHWDGTKQLERKHNDKGYRPSNYCFATRTQQCRNRRSNTKIRAFGEVKSITEWTEDERCPIGFFTLWARLRKGWEAERAIITPKMR